MMNESKPFEILAATALVGLVWSFNNAYRDAAPSLKELRDAPANDNDTFQKLIDADITVGIPAVIAGVVASWVMRSWLPIGVVIVACVAVAGYHHSILSDPDGEHYRKA